MRFQSRRKKFRSVLNGEIVQERDGVALTKFENSYQINFYLLLAQFSAKKAQISVLDFGGGLGTTYRQFKFFTQQKISWTIVEQPQLVAEGQKNFESDELSFTCEIPESKFNVALFSAVLDVVENPYAILAEVIAKISPDLIIIDRSLYHGGCEDYYTIKSTAKHITNQHEYPVAWFSMSCFISRIESMGYNQVDRWDTADGKVVSGFTVGTYHGIVFKKEVKK